METASKDATELQAKHRTEGVNKMSARKSKFQPQHNKGNSRCYRCNNTGHSPFDCKFKNAICHNCNKTGHIKKACMSKSNKKPQSRKFENKKSVHALEEDSDSDNCIASLETFEINNSKSSKDVMWLKPTVEGVTLKMELDTGSAVSVISQADFSKRLGHVKLIEATITLQTYSGESIKPLGCANVKVHYKGETHALPLYVVPKGGPPLFGREWLKHIKLDWNEIREVHDLCKLKNLCIVAFRSTHLIKNTAIIVWDEAPMIHKHVLECVHRTLCDITQIDKPFGGKVVLLGGDFRQVLPVIRHGTQAEIINSNIMQSFLWESITMFNLTINMRVRSNAHSNNQADFENFLLRIGNGKEKLYPNVGSAKIQLPKDLCICPDKMD
ncbi:unnamed protein product [Mytilus edulis]|uniref:ATP-dependent DNA helicase n=1 Tax=Mytilus edulis TaxID=6550 RepID=A0A8S3S833_MYTED|nr:unnamed protein product [Mytilus edulis]